MIDAYRLLKVSCAAALFLGVLTVILGNSNVQEVLLRPPGLRPVKDPSIVIPFDQLYPNQPPNLPKYSDAAGQPVKGWARKYVGTRRFFSDQSALIYYRVSDLAQSKIIQASKAEKALHIWPIGTVIILESYKGDVNSAKSAKFLEIDAMEKKTTLTARPLLLFSQSIGVMPDLPRKESPQLLRKRQGNATSVTVLPFM